MTSKETHWQSLVKAISWRFFGTLSTMLIVYLMTHQVTVSFYVGVLELVTKISLFYVHERLWIWLKNRQWRMRELLSISDKMN
jgi:adenylylsulfate kinase